MVSGGQSLDRTGYSIEFEDEFTTSTLDETRWIGRYLPQWSTPDRTAARYRTGDGRLRLLIEADQPPWSPELDGELRVSSIQTGVLAGPLGSGIGQHRFRPEAVVRTVQEPRTLYTPHHALVEMRARANPDPDVMVALWMIGFEDRPERSAEICIAEIFGSGIRPDRAGVGMGTRPFADPSIGGDFATVELDIDATAYHTYSAEWTPRGVAWFVDDRLVRSTDQSPDYPMQLMLGIYEFPTARAAGKRGAHPKVFEVDWVRGWTRSGRPGGDPG